MNTEIFLENEQLDISADLSALLTMAIDDVRDFSSRQTSFSKTIVLPGTAKNNRVFGHIYDLGQANVYDESQPNLGYNFNAAKSAACIIFQDNIQTFKGVLRILQINLVNGRAEYEVSVFGDLFLLNAKLSGGLLENLDFSEYNHQYSHTNIINSWDNPGGSGYFYPLVDYGTYSKLKHDWDIRTFRPALYAKEYIDKIFAEAGFRYSSNLFNSDRFKQQIVPHNRKRMTTTSDILLELTNTNKMIEDDEGTVLDLFWDNEIVNNPFTGNISSFQYQNTETLTLRMEYSYEIINAIVPGDNLAIRLNINNGFFADWVLSTDGDIKSGYVDLVLHDGDVLAWQVQTTLHNTVWVNMHIKIAGSPTQQIDINVGTLVPLNDTIPKNVRQVDFLLAFVKLYNLYVYEDKFDNRLIHIEPYVDFFDAPEPIDWTCKLNRNKPLTVKPMSELNSKTYKFNYKQDNDYYNDLYNKRYGQGYGSYIYDSLYEFATQENKLEIAFAATPLVGYKGQDKVYSTIFKRTGTDAEPVEETVDSSIRILQAKKITGVDSWDMKNKDTVLQSLNSYGYAGHLDDPDAPTSDLNFGALKELFFALVSGTLSNTQFNLYWSSYMAEVTDKDSKLLTASFYLKPGDIYNLDFSRYITVDGVLFRLNKITDYNLSNPGECQVELLKVNYTQY